MNNSWSAICRSATLSGHEGISGSLDRPPRVHSRISRYSCGFPLSSVYDPTKHDIADRYLDPSDGICKARNQMTWLLETVRDHFESSRLMLTKHQGEEVEEDRMLATPVINNVQVGFWAGGDREFSTTL